MEKHKTFKVGDVVYLNSAPEIHLTIKFIDNDSGDIDCQFWNSSTCKFEQITTSVYTITKVD